MPAACAWTAPTAPPAEPAFVGSGLIGARIPADPLAGVRVMVAGFTRRDPATGATGLGSLTDALPLTVVAGQRWHHRASTLGGQRLDLAGGELVSELTAGPVRLAISHLAPRTAPAVLRVAITAIPEADGPFALRLGAPQPGPGVRLERSLALAGGGWARNPLLGMRSLLVADDGARLGAALMIGQATPGVRWIQGGMGHAEAPACLVAEWDARAGQPIELVCLLALVPSSAHPDPFAQAVRVAGWAREQDGDLLAGHRAAWADLWQGRVLIDGDEDAQRACDRSLYHLWSNLHRAQRTGMPPFGLGHDLYLGHSFWDTETWILPAMMLLAPDLARSLLAFRRRGLAAAQANAAIHGFSGAMFPWEARHDGHEDTPINACTGWLEHHVSLDIAAAFWQWSRLDRDPDTLREDVWPVLREVARWIVDRCTPGPRGWEIRHVIPPDEAAINVDNSAFTNLMAAAVLRAAATCAGEVGARPDPRWLVISGGMAVPRDAHGIREHDAWDDASRPKQADALLLCHPYDLVGAEDARAIAARYLDRDPNRVYEVAMGDAFAAVVAARQGDRDAAAAAFRRSHARFLIEPWGMCAEKAARSHGPFLTGHAGMVSAALLGFPGLQLERDPIAHHPAMLPAGWSAIRCERVWIAGRPHRLHARHGAASALEPLPTPDR